MFKRYNMAAMAGALLVLSILPAGCVKDAPVPLSGEELREIVIGVSDDGLDVGTKATAVTSLPSSLYWGATTGSGTETAKWSNASATVSSSKINTGKYQTASPTAYNYYVSNVSMSVGANTTVSAVNTTDVICGRTAASTSSSPTVTLGHVFARTGSLSLTASGYTLSGVSCTIKSKGSLTGTRGTYNLRTGAWSSVTALSSTALGSSSWSVSGSTATSSSDLYLIPGVYTVTVTYTVTKSGSSKSYTQSGDVTLVAGKRHNITVTPTIISVDIDDSWDTPGGEITP